MNNFQQQNVPLVYQAQNNSGNNQSFRSDNIKSGGAGGNDWDQFFQQQQQSTSGNQGNKNTFLQNNKFDQFGGQNTNMNVGQNGLRLPLGGGMSLEQSMKQALARTVGLSLPSGGNGTMNGAGISADLLLQLQMQQQQQRQSGVMNNNMISQQLLQGECDLQLS